MRKLLFALFLLLCALFSRAQQTDFSRMHFGCDGNSITAGDQWSATVMEQLGFASHHNVAVGSSTWASWPDTQDYDQAGFAGISPGWEPTDDPAELQQRHNNVAMVHIRRFISEVNSGAFPAPDIFVFSLGTNDTRPGNAADALRGDSPQETDLTTMAGGARWAIQTIRETYPMCRVFLCTPIQSGDPERNRFNREKIAVLREICRALSVQVIDCYTGSGILEQFEQPAAAGRYLRDGLHPDKEGQVLMGKYIAGQIRSHYP